MLSLRWHLKKKLEMVIVKDIHELSNCNSFTLIGQCFLDIHPDYLMKHPLKNSHQ